MKKYLDIALNNIEYTSGSKTSADIHINNLSSYVTGEDMNRLSASLWPAIDALNNLKLPSDTR